MLAARGTSIPRAASPCVGSGIEETRMYVPRHIGDDYMQAMQEEKPEFTLGPVVERKLGELVAVGALIIHRKDAREFSASMIEETLGFEVRIRVWNSRGMGTVNDIRSTIAWPGCGDRDLRYAEYMALQIYNATHVAELVESQMILMVHKELKP